MSQVNSLTINDGATPAQPVTFTVSDRDGSSSSFRTSDAALVQGDKTILHRAELAGNGRAANRVRMTFAYPMEAIIDGLTKVIGTSTAVVEINYNQAMTLEQRTAFYGLVANALVHADIKAQNTAVAPLS